MVMSEYVMFNEPGWEAQMNTPDGEAKNLGYCNMVRIANIRYAMIEQL
jgi:ubiquitin-activating enzyme E1-like protein 2